MQVVRLQCSDESLPLVSAKHVRLGGATVETPLRSHSLIHGSPRCSHRLCGGRHQITETYFRMSHEKTVSVNLEAFREQNSRLMSYADDETAKLLIIEYSGGSVPDAATTDKLCDLASSAPGPVVVPPITGAGITDSVDFTNSFVASTRASPSSLIATIPASKPGAVIKAGKKLAKLGITMFALNFEGNDPTNLPIVLGDINSLSSHISAEYGTDCFFYGLNIQRTHVRQHSEIGEGRDILTLVTGIDCLGDIHTMARGNRNNGTRISYTSGGVGDRLNIRLLNSDDYGYYRIPDAIRSISDDRVGLTPSMIRTARAKHTKDLAHAFNTEVQAAEASKYRQIIAEGGLRQYLETKKYATSTLRRITKALDDTRLRSDT